MQMANADLEQENILLRAANGARAAADAAADGDEDEQAKEDRLAREAYEAAKAAVLCEDPTADAPTECCCSTDCEAATGAPRPLSAAVD